MSPRVTRRAFLAGSAVAGLNLAAPWPAFADERPMPLRALGTTGVKVSLAGLGTAQWGPRRVSDREAVRILHRAIDLGINYVDTAYSYGQGHSERRLGLGLKGDRRDKVFLTSKTLPRDREEALAELETSLRRLQTDHVDLWQFHALKTKQDTARLLREGGALEAGLAARKAGKVRFLGITGHEDPHVFVDAMQRHVFDTLLIPLNCIDPWHLSFEEHTLPVAVAKQVGVIAMKVYCAGALLRHKIVKAEDCLRYTYGLPIATCIVGCTRVEEVELIAHVARNLKTMDARERAAVKARTKPHSPELEWYKSPR
ncbi:MAG: aldo/keto reductase [Planctomycetota bacterium]|jgi:aryl-alcohol dehydrogenase-like predicted oxidoreductase